MKKLSRLYNQIYAFINGYFWLPCTSCNNYFGGHEQNLIGFINIRPKRHLICKSCEIKCIKQ